MNMDHDAGDNTSGGYGDYPSGYDAPGYDAPGYDAPGYDAPGYDAPGYGSGGDTGGDYYDTNYNAAGQTLAFDFTDLDAKVQELREFWQKTVSMYKVFRTGAHDTSDRELQALYQKHLSDFRAAAYAAKKTYHSFHAHRHKIRVKHGYVFANPYIPEFSDMPALEPTS